LGPEGDLGQENPSGDVDAEEREREWDRLVEQIANGDCTPFLGAGASSGTLPTASQLSVKWADEYRYPFDDRTDLAKVMQYVSIVEKDPVTVKQRVSEQLQAYGSPAFEHPGEPHGLLASLPMSTYLTTNYDGFMSQALRRADRDPMTVVCPWYRGGVDDPGTDVPRDFEPTVDQPLVYHLHGSFRYPASLVLAEQDYVEFLVNLQMDRGMDDQRVVPISVLPALTRRPLLFIGYSLRDWSFRMLFHGLVQTVVGPQQRRHVSLQLPPFPGPDDLDLRQRAERYLNRYYERLNISVIWGTADEFCTELRRRLGQRESK
jgi:SIR2-like domain